MKVMYLHGHGPGLLHSKTPVRALEDLKGLKIRATGTTAKIVSALGAAPVAMPMSDSYDALSRGVAQGIVCPTESLQGWKLGEVFQGLDLRHEYGCLDNQELIRQRGTCRPRRLQGPA